MAPLHEAFRRKVADVVGKFRPFFVKRAEPNANVLRVDAVVARFFDPVRETRTVDRQPSAYRPDRFGAQRFRVFEKLDPEAALVEQSGKEDVFPVRTFPGIRIDVSFHAPSFQSFFVQWGEFAKRLRDFRFHARRNARIPRIGIRFPVCRIVSVVEHAKILARYLYL